jgi:hypothetical protein
MPLEGELLKCVLSSKSCLLLTVVVNFSINPLSQIPTTADAAGLAAFAKSHVLGRFHTGWKSIFFFGVRQ